MKIKPITRIKKPTIEEFQQEFLKGNQPVIISGVAQDWPAYQKWTPETFKQKFGNVLGPMRGSDNELEMFFGEEKPKTVMSIAEYIELIESTPSSRKRIPYFCNIIFDDPVAKPHLDPLRTDLDFPNYFPENSRIDLRLWIGASGQKSTIHNDSYDNLNAQIFGEKALLLFSPEQHDPLYAVRLDDGLWSSPIDPQQPDLEKYPKFKEAIALEGTLKAGEILFIPAFWWHQFRSLTTSINVNMWVEMGDEIPLYEKTQYWQSRGCATVPAPSTQVNTNKIAMS